MQVGANVVNHSIIRRGVVEVRKFMISNNVRLTEFRDRWQLQTYDQLNQVITLESLKVELPLPEIYRRVNFVAVS
jgi:hypothetical protein